MQPITDKQTGFVRKPTAYSEDGFYRHLPRSSPKNNDKGESPLQLFLGVGALALAFLFFYEVLPYVTAIHH